MKKNIFLKSWLLVLFLGFSAVCFALSEEAKKKGFVYLNEIDRSILISPRYSTSENFLGRLVDGYNKPVIIMTRQAAQALKKVQEDVAKDGYCLVVYDAYRPQRAVDNFVKWSKDIADQIKKSQYYPRVNKADVFELGYVASRSGHSRGSTIDLTLIRIGDSLHEITEEKRKLLDGFEITFLNDGTVDMGSSFDLFDKASHFENNLLDRQYQEPREYLHDKMIKHGFKPYSNEWWHFTLNNEPYPASQDSSYFNFPVE